VGQIGVISGRYYAMDRDNRWDRVELAYNALTKGEGVKGTDAVAAVQASYDDDKTDEFVMPTVIEKDGKPVATIQDKDSVVFFNFRPDRAREITRAFCDDDFKDWILPMYALQITMIRFRTNWLLSINRRSKTLLANIWQRII